MTIRKGTNRAKQVIANARNIRGYSLANNFAGNPLAEHPQVWGGPVVNNRHTELVTLTQQEFLQHELDTYHAKLTENNGRFTIQIHSNLWYEFESGVQS